MNTKRRVLSFLMALVMVLGVMAVLPITINAADANGEVDRAVDIRYIYEYLKENDYESYKDVLDTYERIDYIPYAATAPTLDGKISNNEYTVVNPIIISTYNTGHGQMGQNAYSKNLTRSIRNVNEYIAQDAENVYFAFVLPGLSHYSEIPYFYFDVRVDYSNYNTSANRNSMQKRYNSYALQIRVNTSTGDVTITNNGAGSCASKMDESKYTNTAEQTVKYVAPTAQDTNAYVEYRINKAQLMAVMNVAELKDLSYGLCYFSKSGSTQQCNFIANLSDVNAANIKSFANGSHYAVYRNIGLYDISEYLNGGFNVREDLVSDFGFKNYVVNGFVDAAPVADGVINANEYTLVENVPATDTKNNASGLDVVEYYAQDEDYVYYAITAPYSTDTTTAYIRIKSTTAQKVGDNFYNSYQLGCVANENVAESTFTADGGRNVRGDYSSHQASFVKEDFQLVGKINGEETVTYELRISRDKMAAAAGVEDIDHYAYYVIFGSKHVAYKLSEGDNGAYAKIMSFENAVFDPYTKVSGYVMATGTVGKNVILVNPDIQTYDLGSIRIDTAETSGLRFQTIVSKAYLAEKEAEGYTVTAGTIIAPEDFNIAEHTDGTVNEHYLDVVANLEYPYDTSDKYITFTGAIVKINPGNLDRDFTAIGYLALTKGGNTEYVYSNAVTKNVSEVAQAAIDSGKYNEDPDALEILNGLLAN